MNLPTLEDRDLMFLLSTQGIRFLNHTYDVVPTAGGFGLRIVGPQGPAAFELCLNEADLILALRAELEEATYSHILGRPYPQVAQGW